MLYSRLAYGVVFALVPARKKNHDQPNTFTAWSVIISCRRATAIDIMVSHLDNSKRMNKA